MNPLLREIPTALAREAKRVLVINVTRIGDTLLATPALRAIAAFFPNAAITCLGHPKRVEVLANISYLSKVGEITKNSAGWRGLPSIISGAEYDWAFVWGEDDALTRYALRKARYVVAQRPKGVALWKDLYVAVDVPHFASVHAVSLALSITDAVGIPRQGLGLDAVVTHAEAAAAKQTLREEWLDHGAATGPLIGMQVASFPTKAYRDWPIGHFAMLIDKTLALAPTARFVIFGSADDRARGQELQTLFPDQVRVVAGKLTLRQTAALMAQMQLYIGVDTGPTHLFAALSRAASPPVPMVVIYHPSIPSALYKPLDHPRLYAIDHPLAAPGCSKKVAIGDISVDAVFSLMRAALVGEPPTMPGLPAADIEAPAWPVK